MDKNEIQLEILSDKEQALVEVEVETAEKKKNRLRLILDTGSNVTILNQHKFLDAKTIPFQLKVKTFTKESEGTYEKIFINLRTPENESIYSGYAFLTKLPETSLFDGVIGNDVLSAFQLVLDFPDRVYLRKKKKLISNEYKVFSYREVENHILLDCFWKEKEEKKLRLIFDTGAGLTYIHKKFLNGEKREVLNRHKYFDLSGEIKETESYLIRNFCLGGRTYCDSHLEVLSGSNELLKNFFEGQEADGIIGYNYIRKHRIVIDYGERKIYLKRKNKAFMFLFD